MPKLLAYPFNLWPPKFQQPIEGHILLQDGFEGYHCRVCGLIGQRLDLLRKECTHCGVSTSLTHVKPSSNTSLGH